MKMTLLLLMITLMSMHVMSAQTKLVSHHLNLQKPDRYHQTIATVDSETDNIFLFAADKEKTTIYRYNRAFFMKDTIVTDSPSKEFINLSGYSFSNEQPCLYWSTVNLKKIQAVQFDLKNKNTAVRTFELLLKDEEILMHFSQSNTFYLITILKLENKLKFYQFQGTAWFEKILDFSTIKFFDSSNNLLSFHDIIASYPIRKLDATTGNSLVEASFQTKMYVRPEKLILSFDHNPAQTQILQIDLQTFEITENTFPQPPLQSESQSNSFICDASIFQVKANGSELAFQIIDLETSKVRSTNRVSSTENIFFANSPLLSQTGNKEARIFKSTQKFLNRLKDSDLAIATYGLPNGKYLVSIGGVRNVASASNIALGVTLIAAEIMVGDGITDFSTGADRLQVSFFDALFDTNFNHIPQEVEPLAANLISNFIASNQKINLYNTFKFDDFYVLGYFDATEKQYVMRKFEDGFPPSDSRTLRERPVLKTGFNYSLFPQK